ncbi:MAG: NAD(P)H-dependent glycerol-3-phosphate dehydrogenase [Cyclobacteriaceae bacterium]
MKAIQKKTSFSVLGTGSWGTALVKILTENGYSVRWWGRNKSRIKEIKSTGTNPHYLTSVSFVKSRVKTTHRINRAVDGSNYVVFAIPSAFLKEAVEKLEPKHFKGKEVICCIKGVVPGEDLSCVDFLKQRFSIPDENITLVSGPTHAEEIALRKLSYLTVVNKDIDKAKAIQKSFSSSYIETNVLSDVEGVEYSSIIKNVISIACGVAHGLKYGDNFQAVLVANAVKEITAFLDTVCPMDRNINHSVYLGDVLVTAYSQFSRNRTLGSMLGKGYSVKAAMADMTMVSEGYYAAKSIYKIAMDKGTSDLPICFTVYRILYQNANAEQEFKNLRGKLM